MRSFQAIMEEYGADYQNTLDRFLGKKSFYLKMLGMLPEDKNMQRLEEALSKGDLGGAFDAAHTMKGVAGNLGLAPLYDAICAIVEPLRIRESSEDYPALCRGIKEELLRAQQLYEQLKEAAERDG